MIRGKRASVVPRGSFAVSATGRDGKEYKTRINVPLSFTQQGKERVALEALTRIYSQPQFFFSIEKIERV